MRIPVCLVPREGSPVNNEKLKFIILYLIVYYNKNRQDNDKNKKRKIYREKVI